MSTASFVYTEDRQDTEQIQIDPYDDVNEQLNNAEYQKTQKFQRTFLLI